MCAIWGFSSFILQISKPVTQSCDEDAPGYGSFSMGFVEVHSTAKAVPRTWEGHAEPPSETPASFPESPGQCWAQLSAVQDSCCHCSPLLSPAQAGVSQHCPDCSSVLQCQEPALLSTGHRQCWKNQNLMHFYELLSTATSNGCQHALYLVEIAPYSPFFLSNHSCLSSEFFLFVMTISSVFTGWFTDLLLPSVCWNLLCRSGLPLFCPA